MLVSNLYARFLFGAAIYKSSRRVISDLSLSQALGKTGKVIKIYSDGDLRVALDIHGHTWTFNPLSVVPVSSGTNAMAAVQDNANRSRDRSGTFIFII